jgi:hypothetical protein
MDLSLEESVKVKVVLPFLYSLGFGEDELHFETSFTFKAGLFTYKTDTEEQCRTLSPRLDILVTRNGINLFIVEVKGDIVSISDKDVEQATSYARLLHPVTPFTIVTNGREFHLYDSLTRKEIEKGSFKVKDRYEVAISEEARYEALKHFIGYSKANVTAFCRQQVLEHMKPLIGSKEDLSKKYIPELHTRCHDLVAACRDLLQSDRALLPIYGDSGIGKTCSLCDFALQLLEDGHPVLFYRAREILSRLTCSIADDFNWGPFSTEQSDIQIIRRITDLFADAPLTICIDALDEWTLENRVDILDNFVRHAGSFRIKLLVTCTTHAWPPFLSQRGVPTHISAAIYRTANDESGYHLRSMTDEQYYHAIDKYRELYGFTGRFEDRVLRDGKRSPYLLRVFFEVAQKHKMKDLTFSRIEFFDAYYDQTLEKLNDRQIAAATLREVARCLLDNDRDHIDLDTIRGRLGLGVNEKLMPPLFDYNVLDLSTAGHSRTLSFYFPIFRDYVVAYHLLKLQDLPLRDYQAIVDQYSNNQIFQQALKLFYPMAPQEKQAAIDHQLRCNAAKYLRQYCDIIDTLFPNLKGAFAPNTSGEVGFIAEMSIKDRELTMYGFRALSQADTEQVKLIPVDRSAAKQSNLPYLHGAGGLHCTGSANGFKEINTLREVLIHEIEPQLRNIVRSGRLNESRNRYLLLEKLIATLAKYQGRHHNIVHPYRIADCLPISFGAIDRARRYEKATMAYRDQLIDAKRRTGEIKETWHGSCVSYSYSLTDADKKEIHDRAVLAANNNVDITSNVRYLDYDKADTAIVDAMRSLSALGIGSINEVILPRGDREWLGQGEWDHYSYNTLVATVERVYRLFLNEYKVLIETNFGRMANQFGLYSKMPLKCFVVLSSEGTGKSCSMDVYMTRKDDGDNEVVLIKGHEIGFDYRTMMLFYGGSEFRCESVRGSGLTNFIYGHHDYIDYPVDNRLMVLRNLVYDEIEGDMDKLINWIRSSYGVAAA